MLDYQSLGYQVIWILHDSHYNRSRLTPAEIQLRSSPHYFTNINTFGKGIFYDQYSFTRHKTRIRRTPRLPLQFKKVLTFNVKQLPRQLPAERKKWPLFFRRRPSQLPSSLAKALFISLRFRATGPPISPFFPPSSRKNLILTID